MRIDGQVQDTREGGVVAIGLADVDDRGAGKILFENREHPRASSGSASSASSMTTHRGLCKASRAKASSRWSSLSSSWSQRA